MIDLYNLIPTECEAVKIDIPEGVTILLAEPNGHVIHLMLSKKQWADLTKEVTA